MAEIDRDELEIEVIRQKIEEGRRAVKEGRVVPNEQVIEELQTMIQETKAEVASSGKRKKKLISETRKYLVLWRSRNPSSRLGWMKLN